ncbi:MAG: nitroreductase family protein [Acidimicrobiales bacterium]
MSPVELRAQLRARFPSDTSGAEIDHAALQDVVGDGNHTLATMLGHRICRQFSPDPLDDDLLSLLLSAAFSTPSKSDLQQCSVIVVQDPDRRNAIAQLIPTMPWIAEAARFLVFCGDSRRIRGVSQRAGLPFENDHLDAFLNAAGDAAMHLSSFVWAAESVGLGTCPISVVRNHIEEVSAIVALPDHVFPFAGLCVGWPQRLRPLSPRLPLAVTVHRDQYDDERTPTLIKDYDGARLEGRTVPAQHQVDVERWGVSETYGWSTEKARMVARREREQLARFLRARGFNLE